ncbi:hypothetical protein ACS0TY_027625 [Phlomoides rotata]
MISSSSISNFSSNRANFLIDWSSSFTLLGSIRLIYALLSHAPLIPGLRPTRPPRRGRRQPQSTTPTTPPQPQEKIYGKPVVVADREMVEEKADDMLFEAQSNDPF